MNGEQEERGRDEVIAALAARRRAIARAISTGGEPAFLHANLTMRQLRLVVTLSLNGPMSAHELAGSLGVGPGTLTGIVDRLVSQELVLRHEDPGDRRVRRVALSDAGAELVERILDWGDRQWRTLLEQVDTSTLRDYERVLGELQAAAERMHTRVVSEETH